MNTVKSCDLSGYHGVDPENYIKLKKTYFNNKYNLAAE